MTMMKFLYMPLNFTSPKGFCTSLTAFGIHFYPLQKNVTYDASKNGTEATSRSNSSSSSSESSLGSTRNFSYTSLGRDCPLDKNKLGRYTWGLLHTMAAFYSDTPTESQKKDVKQFFTILARVYPCEYCARDFQKE